jgi:hypothetical protein
MVIFLGSCKRYDRDIIVISADDLIAESKKSMPWSVHEKYKLKIIQITGKILNISYPKEGHLFFDKFSISFGKLDNNGHLTDKEVYIVCSFDNNDNIKYDLSEGSEITLIGNFDRYSSSLFSLKHCKIIDKK